MFRRLNAGLPLSISVLLSVTFRSSWLLQGGHPGSVSLGYSRLGIPFRTAPNETPRAVRLRGALSLGASYSKYNTSVGMPWNSCQLALVHVSKREIRFVGLLAMPEAIIFCGYISILAVVTGVVWQNLQQSNEQTDLRAEA